MDVLNVKWKQMVKRLEKDPYFGLFLVLPLLLWVLATLLYPLGEALVLSFKNVGYVGTAGNFVGVKNYLKLFASTGFWATMWRTLVWTGLNVGLQIGLALLGAFILNQDFFGQRFVRNWIIIPWVLPSIVLATLGKWVLDPSLGVINYLLRSLGLIDKPISFLGNPSLALPAVTLLNVWRWSPFFLVTFLAALQTIPKELYEAAAIDGATGLARIFHVDLPGILPVLKVQTIICTLWAANIFDTIWLLTRGGPAEATTTLTIQVYLKAFQEFRISESAAIAIVMFVILFLGCLSYFWQVMTRDWEE